MTLPVRPPVPPMLARLARELARDGYLYEPKWDGFRCLAFRDGAEIDLRSRHDRPFSRYFPEIAEALAAVGDEAFALDGELVVLGDGGFDFTALMSRLHPAASRVERLRRETPAALIAFDLLAAGGEDLRARPFAERRARLERLLHGADPPLFVTPVSGDESDARRWLGTVRVGVDGVVAKHPASPYEPGKRAMVKVKPRRTADCVVAGFRWMTDRPLPSSLLLGLYDDAGALHHVGVATSFAQRQRERLYEELTPLAVRLEGHPWQHGFLVGGSPMGRLKGAAGRWTPDMTQDWVPLAPTRVCEVSYDHVDGDRFRHPARFLRWRPDRDPRSCGFDQFERAAAGVDELLALA